MKRAVEITSGVTEADFEAAILEAAREHTWKKEVKDAVSNLKDQAKALYEAYRDGSYTSLLNYRPIDVQGNDGKLRHCDSPDFITRVFQHLWLIKIRPVYDAKDPGNGLNCKPGCGVTAKDPKKSVIHRMKSIFYSRLELEYAVVIDQRKCYEHTTRSVFRKALSRLIDDPAFVEFSCKVVFKGNTLPIGTPSSPLAHHIVMLPFDYYANEIAGKYVRYADDCALFFRTKEEAQRAKWRVKFFWWYELGIRAKRQAARVVPLSDPLDFCGYVFHRGGGGHSKGFVTPRRSTVERAKKATEKNWGSYFGLLKHADSFALMLRIEHDMKLSQLTNTIRIQRNLDAPHADIKEIAGKTVTVMDYEIRKDKDGNPDWIKLLLSVPTEEGINLAREIHGGYSYLVEFIDKAEKAFGKDKILPLEDVVIENQCGYIFRDSTNQIKEFPNDQLFK